MAGAISAGLCLYVYILRQRSNEKRTQQILLGEHTLGVSTASSKEAGRDSPHTALVTGGAGFIGSHLCEDLVRSGHRVYALDDFSSGRPENVAHLEESNRFHLTHGRVESYPLVDKLVSECDVVYHLAARVGVKFIMEQPLETIRSNVTGTETILDVAAKRDTKVLLASSSEVYGYTASEGGYLAEHDNCEFGPPTNKRWAYALSKLYCESLAMTYVEEHGLPVVVVRIFAMAGPRQTGRYAMVIPAFVRNALEGRPLEIYGSGEQVRSFLHVADGVAALRQLMECQRAAAQVVNVGSDEEITLNQLARTVKRTLQSSSEIINVSYEEIFGEGFEEMSSRLPHISLLRGLVDFQRSYSLEDIIVDVAAQTEIEAPEEVELREAMLMDLIA